MSFTFEKHVPNKRIRKKLRLTWSMAVRKQWCRMCGRKLRRIDYVMVNLCYKCGQVHWSSK